MTTVYKYPFSISQAFDIPLPRGAKVLSVQLQDGRPTLWAMVDTARELCLRQFLVFGTGTFIPDVAIEYGLNFVSTLQYQEFVWHLFEVRDNV